MKTIKKLIFFSMLFLTQMAFSQKENTNWTFGNNIWNFDFDTGDLNTSTFSNIPMARFQGSATYSDPNTGQLLFYTDGYEIYNKNHSIMENGSYLYSGSSQDYGVLINGLISGQGLSTLQPAVIVPQSGSSLYYVFLNGNYTSRYYYTTEGLGSNGPISSANFGLQYAIVDMSENNGLGKVISKQNILLPNVSNGMTVARHKKDNSYWLVIRQSQEYFYAYEITENGLNLSPVISNASSIYYNASDIIKISPDGQNLFAERFLYKFNNETGIISSPYNFLPSDYETSAHTSYAEFSPNSKILYIAIGYRCLCMDETPLYRDTGIGMYNLETDEASNIFYFPETTGVASLQLSQNGKIYLTFSQEYYPSWGSTIRLFKDWATIDNPDTWSPTSDPISNYYNYNWNDDKFMSLTFPQIIPNNFSTSSCLTNLDITNPITSSQDFQVSNKITATSKINDNLTVNFKGNKILLEPGFEVNSYSNGNFSAIIDPCSASKGINSKNNSSDFALNEEDDITTPILYPNPTNRYFSIDNAEKILEWEIVDKFGKSIKQGRGDLNKTILIDLGIVPKGIYYFNATLKDGELYQTKIIVK